jgi:RHS repeat-associated protein
MAQINPIRYATKYYDSETGLYYFGQRYLDPVTGQWLNREPLGESESVNLYAYCHNDPINRVDVLGLKEYRVKAGAVPVLIAESNGNFGIYLQTESLAIRPLASSCVGAHGFCWADDAPYRVGAVGEATAEKFLSGEIGQSSISSWYALATANFDVMSAEQDLEDLRTMGQILPGFGAGMQFAEGNRITGSAYLVRDVLLFATGTKYIQGASSLSGFALRGAALGAGLGGTSGLIDVTSGRLQAAANGENYDGTIQGDTWTVLRGTRNGAVLGAVLGPLAKLGKMKAAKGGINVASGVGGEVLPMQIVKSLPPGTAGGIVNEVKALTFATGNEHALVRLASGERALVSGGPGGIAFGEGQVTRIIGHTHPYGTASVGASAADRAALQTLGQTHSYIQEAGRIIRFGPTP